MSLSDFGERYASKLFELSPQAPKNQITTLTVLADENSASHGKEIVAIICKRLTELNPNARLPTLYVMDSILKMTNGAYFSLFESVVLPVLSDTYHNGSDKTR